MLAAVMQRLHTVSFWSSDINTSLELVYSNQHLKKYKGDNMGLFWIFLTITQLSVLKITYVGYLYTTHHLMITGLNLPVADYTFWEKQPIFKLFTSQQDI